jgi:hypothetical protein
MLFYSERVGKRSTPALAKRRSLEFSRNHSAGINIKHFPNNYQSIIKTKQHNMHSTQIIFALVALLGVSISNAAPIGSLSSYSDSSEAQDVPLAALFKRTIASAEDGAKIPRMNSPKQLEQVLAALTSDNDAVLEKLKPEIASGAFKHELPYGKDGKTMTAAMNDGLATLTIDGVLVASTRDLNSADDFFVALSMNLVSHNE